MKLVAERSVAQRWKIRSCCRTVLGRWQSLAEKDTTLPWCMAAARR